MSYFKTDDNLKRRDNLIAFRASTEDRQKAEALKSLMCVASTSEVFRLLIAEKANELGVA